MVRCGNLLAAVVVAVLPARGKAWGPSASFDCAQRKLAYEYGKALLPRMGSYESL